MGTRGSGIARPRVGIDGHRAVDQCAKHAARSKVLLGDLSRGSAVSCVIAGDFIDRIEKACLALAHFPNRGSRRDELRPGLRILGFERRTAIAYVVTGNEVVIARVFYGGRDIALHSLGLDDD